MITPNAILQRNVLNGGRVMSRTRPKKKQCNTYKTCKSYHYASENIYIIITILAHVKYFI